MNLSFKNQLAEKYTNASQISRILTEAWVLNEIYCPSCGGPIINYPNNKPVSDFYCSRCVEDFELKSKKGKFGKKVSAGAHSQMVSRINASDKPNFFFLASLATLSVGDFFVIPKHYFVSDIIEKRKPLSPTARRAGWIGSNILFSKIPNSGKIYYIENGKEISKKYVLEKWHKTVFLKQIKNTNAKGWILDVMNCIEATGKKEFSLADLYQFMNELKERHPENNNIQAKIRQQLQILRNKNYLEFTGKGTYRLA